MKDYQKIFVRDYRLELLIGVYEREHKRPQPVQADVDLYLRERPSSGDDVKQVLNYEWIPVILERIAREPRVNLLETFAERLVSAYFEDERVCGVRIGLLKSNVCAQAAGLGYELMRWRDSL